MTAVLVLAECADTADTAEGDGLERLVEVLRANGHVVRLVRRGRARGAGLVLDLERPAASMVGLARAAGAAPGRSGAVVVTDGALLRWATVVARLRRCPALVVAPEQQESVDELLRALDDGSATTPPPVGAPAEQPPGAAPSAERLGVSPVHVDGRPLRRLVRSRSLHEAPLVALADGELAAGEDPHVGAARHLARGGVLVVDGAPRSLTADAARMAAERGGAAALRAARETPQLLPWLEVGAWCRAGVRDRALRHVLVRGIALPVSVERQVDAAYWTGVRSSATAVERRALTRSYVVLAYHRVAGERAPGQDRLDLRPELFHRQMRLLRRLGMRPVAVEALSAAPSLQRPLRRRGVLVTLDDGYLDAVEAAERACAAQPHVYLPTALVGSVAAWAGDAPLASWERVRQAAAAGVVVGAHGRRHRPLAGLPPAELRDEVAGSLSELRTHVPTAVDVLAYPNGRHDVAVVNETARAGFSLAWTTEPGRNGAGTHPLCLRRVGVKDWDGAPALVWKLVTGRPLPALWERLALARWRRSAPSASVP